jgi:hypothetical protein
MDHLLDRGRGQQTTKAAAPIGLEDCRTPREDTSTTSRLLRPKHGLVTQSEQRIITSTPSTITVCCHRTQRDNRSETHCLIENVTEDPAPVTGVASPNQAGGADGPPSHETLLKPRIAP